MATQPADADATAGLADLCSKVQPLTPPSSFGPEAWYLLIGAIIAQSPQPQHLASLYTYLTRGTSTDDATAATFSTPAARRRLSQRFRDLLLKQVTLVGAPQVLCALMPLAKADAVDWLDDVDTDAAASAAAAGGSQQQTNGTATTHATPVAAAAAASTLSPAWSTANLDTATIHARGTRTIDSIYGPTLLPQIFASFGAHTADVQFMELFGVYGLYLSEFTHLSALETELVVFATITCTGLRGPGLWHLRGMGRLLGARGRDEGEESVRGVKDVLRGVKVAMMEVVEWCGGEMVRRSGLDGGVDGSGWANVGDVVRELGGWGDDAFVEEAAS